MKLKEILEDKINFESNRKARNHHSQFKKDVRNLAKKYNFSVNFKFDIYDNLYTLKYPKGKYRNEDTKGFLAELEKHVMVDHILGNDFSGFAPTYFAIQVQIKSKYRID